LKRGGGKKKSTRIVKKSWVACGERNERKKGGGLAFKTPSCHEEERVTEKNSRKKRKREKQVKR